MTALFVVLQTIQRFSVKNIIAVCRTKCYSL